MNTHQVTVEFRGICTHFRDTVPGVPHRVVIPRSSSWNAGFIRWPDSEEPMLYFLPPHFSYLYCKDEQQGEPQHLQGPGVLNSWIYGGVRLQIANAIGPALDYRRSFDEEVPKVAGYVPAYQYSQDVVLGGRAECYFDAFCGIVASYLYGNAWRTTITMETDGPPQLQITLLQQRRGTGVPVANVPVRPYVVVGNSSQDTTDASLDFLWHLLTCREGIPQELAQLPYGAGTAPGPQRGSQRVAKLEVPYWDLLPWDIADIETDASCSNSQYP
ncbi:MAG: hypothetical protein ABI779_01605 [Acidobacteriota bacterium]